MGLEKSRTAVENKETLASACIILKLRASICTVLLLLIGSGVVGH